MKLADSILVLKQNSQ